MFGRRLVAAAILIAVVSATLLITGDAGAIPAFARKYQMSCTTCHAPFPHLKAYGDEFAARGFRMEPGQEPARATYDVGDPLLLLPRDLPLAVRLEGYASYKEDALAENDVEWPWVWKILSGGPLSASASYYFYFLSERGEVVGLEDAFVQFNGIFGAPVDLMVGQFQVSDLMFKRELRLERSDYLIYKTEVGTSRLNLTYDRGLVLSTVAPGDIGVELEVVNGNGIGPADENHGFDNDKYKNPALRLSREFHGVEVGIFGYFAKYRSQQRIDNETWYFGPDLSVPVNAYLQLNAQYLERRDDNPLFEVPKPADRLETRGGFAEALIYPEGPDGRWVLAALYNKVDSDDDEADAETATLTVNRLLARNVRLLVEGERDLQEGRTRASVGLITAF